MLTRNYDQWKTAAPEEEEEPIITKEEFEEETEWEELSTKLAQVTNSAELVRRSLENKDTKGFRRKQLMNNLEDIKKYVKVIKELTGVDEYNKQRAEKAEKEWRAKNE